MPDKPPPHYMYIGAGVGWQRRRKICQSLRELDNQGTVFVFVFLAVTMMVIELRRRSCCCAEWRTLKLRTRRMIASRSVNMARHPQGSYLVIPTAVSGVATPETQ